MPKRFQTAGGPDWALALADGDNLVVRCGPELSGLHGIVPGLSRMVCLDGQPIDSAADFAAAVNRATMAGRASAEVVFTRPAR